MTPDHLHGILVLVAMRSRILPCINRYPTECWRELKLCRKKNRLFIKPTMKKRFKLFGDIFTTRDEIILRDYLALERTRLANERTLLAYSRTSLYMLLGGIAFLQMQDFTNIRWVGIGALSISLLMMMVGIFRYFQIKFRLAKYYRKRNEEGEAV
jgi:putative membrane protein